MMCERFLNISGGNFMNRQEKEKQILLRKKLWEIDASFKCSVIGTCLSCSEMRKLSKEKVFAIAPGYDDYQLHTQFITISRQPDLKGKSLHKYLEKKYRIDTRKYFMVTTDAEIEALWHDDLLEGRVQSGWWAVMTHPQVSMDLVDRLYGQLHMQGHNSVSSSHKNKLEIKELNIKVTALEEVLGAERQMYRREKQKFKEQLSILAMETDRMDILVRENQFLREKIISLNQDQAGVSAPRNADQQEIGVSFRDGNEAASDPLLLRETEAKSRKKIEEMKKELCRLERQKVEQAQEIASLEKMLLQFMNQDEPCQICVDQDTEKCPGRNLCGRTVLYVGGLNKMVPHYRQMVENFGGCFIHHDGGKEVSRNILPKMLIAADAVLCPIDCVSHDACNCAKKICKRNQKPFVLMRSASLSSLAKGLSSIVEQ
jgi:hypothetical protein